MRGGEKVGGAAVVLFWGPYEQLIVCVCVYVCIRMRRVSGVV